MRRQRALERNLDIAVERLNPQTFDFSLAALDANYRPTLTSNFGMRSQTAFRAQPDGRRRRARHRHADEQLRRLTQNMKWGGGSFAVGFNNNRQAQSDAFAIRNPALNTNFTRRVRAAAAAQLPHRRHHASAAAGSPSSISRFPKRRCARTITRTLANVRNAYWDLVYAIQAADVAERSLSLATQARARTTRRASRSARWRRSTSCRRRRKRPTGARRWRRRRRRAGRRSSR